MASETLPAPVFVSYSHKDRKWLDDLRPHLTALARDRGIEVWDDTRIRAGEQWREEIHAALTSARIAVLLVSANFLESSFIADNELPPLLEAAESGGTMILQIVLGPCRIERHPVLSRFQFVNPPSRTLRHMRTVARDEVFLRLTNRIEEVLDHPARSSAAERPDVVPALIDALEAQYEACRANRVPIRSFHRLLLLFRIASEYMACCFGTVAPGLAPRVESWLRRQAERQVEIEAGGGLVSAPADTDPILEAARVAARQEGAAEIGVRHFFLALLADRESATVEKIRKALSEEGFGALVNAARSCRAEPMRSLVSDLTL